MKEHNIAGVQCPEKSTPSRTGVMINSVAVLRRCFFDSIGQPAASLLSEEVLQETLQGEKVSYRKRLFCPMVTLWAWLCQVLDADKSCKNALSRIIAYLGASGQAVPSTCTAAYCRARKRLNTLWVLGLIRKTGTPLHQQAPSHWLWCGRRVAVVDGSTVLMADTPANQQQYPQHKKQKQGCGFPIARIVALFSLATGAVMDGAIAEMKTGEVNLFRPFYQRLHAGWVILGDRLFGSYADITWLAQQGIDSVFRLHGRRKCDFRRGKRLGRWDHLVVWQKPKQCPPGMSKERFGLLPPSQCVREVRFLMEQIGFRTKPVTLVTTLLDANAYPKSSLAQLYGLRWQAEISLRHLKTRMQMEFLSCKTPEMVQKEFYIHLLAYNLIRTVQSQAGQQHTVQPTTLSFAATVQHVRIFVTLMAVISDERRRHVYTLLLVLVASEKLRDRPHRREPRVKKRRPKPYPWMTKPRQDYQKQSYAA